MADEMPSPKIVSITDASEAVGGVEPNAEEKPEGYYASICPGKSTRLDPKFCEAVLALQTALGRPVWLLIQHQAEEQFGELDETLARTFLLRRKQLPEEPIALLIDSLGGRSRSAFQIAKLLRQACGDYVSVVPRIAKSAATLLALGGSKLYMSPHAELGPLDSQVFDDPDRGWHSTLDDVQALDRLHAFALEASDRNMFMFIRRTGKKIDTLLPISLEFVSDLMRPLFEKIDAIHYSEFSRVLKEGEEYTIRLLRQRFTQEQAEQIARRLVMNYPDHGFVIDPEEAADMGLGPETTVPELTGMFDALLRYAGKQNIIGELRPLPRKETKNEELQQKRRAGYEQGKR